MSELLRSILDLVVIGVVGGGLVQVGRLIKHLAGLRQGRIEMERFVYEFNATVIRAEAGIKGLRTAARDSGDDLEKLVEKAVMIRDELQYIVQSADQIAERLSKAASSAIRTEPTQTKPAAKPPEAAKPVAKAEPAKVAAGTTERKTDGAPTSNAEKELLQALQKLS
jgi:hypothetical protein